MDIEWITVNTTFFKEGKNVYCVSMSIYCTVADYGVQV